jgi:acetoacetyl-CoA synthetase
MPLFVALKPGSRLTEELKDRINGTIRQLTSARHVPDDIIAVPAVPVTHALKKIEVPIKKLFTGHSPDTAINLGSLANPESVDWFIDQARLYLSEHHQ